MQPRKSGRSASQGALRQRNGGGRKKNRRRKPEATAAGSRRRRRAQHVTKRGRVRARTPSSRRPRRLEKKTSQNARPRRLKLSEALIRRLQASSGKRMFRKNPYVRQAVIKAYLKKNGVENYKTMPREEALKQYECLKAAVAEKQKAAWGRRKLKSLSESGGTVPKIDVSDDAVVARWYEGVRSSSMLEKARKTLARLPRTLGIALDGGKAGDDTLLRWYAAHSAARKSRASAYSGKRRGPTIVKRRNCF